ncbi:MAG: hypothetical protein HKN45_02600, partial [Flavobacteriales bacterium]|nr:hypothetical protein [Flavobacteriales bacterium]
MKYFYSLLSLFLIFQLNAQNTVTFSVDMSEYAGSYTMVNLNGNFNAWCGECAPMSDDDGDGIYELDVDLADGTYEYKFTVDGWTDDETLTPGLPCTLTSGEFTNRLIEVSGDTTIPTVCWESCSECGVITSADVTFKVDMSEYTGPSFTTVNLNGSFNGWCGECAMMTDDDGNNIYELTVNILTGTIEYKFTLDGWTSQEEFTEGTPCTSTIDGFTNRTLEVSQETELNAVCWNECQACGASSVLELSPE